MSTIILGEKVKVTDPCYKFDTWCSQLLDIKSGEYTPIVKQINTDWGARVKELLLIHSSRSYDSNSEYWKLCSSQIGVDSGQCGIFDAEYYKEQKVLDDKFEDEHGTDIKSDKWFYGKCCIGTTNPIQWAPIDSKGVVSSSGYGDGMYDLYTIEENNKVVAMKLVFIGDDDE